mmetsp:Transcript_63793/g.176947  ORF Transcript_63793/g.176947 Transcript_63793/m.176947 type:complete len:299 (+) Transcript_63793:207-1103(+)
MAAPGRGRTLEHQARGQVLPHGELVDARPHPQLHLERAGLAGHGAGDAQQAQAQRPQMRRPDVPPARLWLHLVQQDVGEQLGGLPQFVPALLDVVQELRVPGQAAAESAEASTAGQHLEVLKRPEPQHRLVVRSAGGTAPGATGPGLATGRVECATCPRDHGRTAPVGAAPPRRLGLDVLQRQLHDLPASRRSVVLRVTLGREAQEDCGGEAHPKAHEVRRAQVDAGGPGGRLRVLQHRFHALPQEALERLRVVEPIQQLQGVGGGAAQGSKLPVVPHHRQTLRLGVHPDAHILGTWL